MRDSARSILESGTQILAKAAANNNTDARQHLMASGHKNEVRPLQKETSERPKSLQSYSSRPRAARARCVPRLVSLLTRMPCRTTAGGCLPRPKRC